MKKELKFRAWVTDVKVMGQVTRMQGEYGIPLKYVDVVPFKSQPKVTNKKVSQVNMMQFTGLKDAKGKEIYEGDIVLMWLVKGESKSKYFTGKVVNHGFLGMSIDTDRDYMDFESPNYEYEIIGNEFENPELLK